MTARIVTPVRLSAEGVDYMDRLAEKYQTTRSEVMRVALNWATRQDDFPQQVDERAVRRIRK
jgi:predicted transcriptional regulator